MVWKTFEQRIFNIALLHVQGTNAVPLFGIGSKIICGRQRTLRLNIIEPFLILAGLLVCGRQQG